MRGILVDWLIDVHLKFKLVNETMFLCVNLIDRYLETTQVSRTKLQLVGVTCMFIASKYEEIYPPDLRDFVYVTDKAYTKQQILQCEGQILLALNFNITFNSSYLFLQRFNKLTEQGEQCYWLSRYLIELALVEYGMIKFSQKMIAAAALYLSCKIFKKPAWSQLLTVNCQMQESEVRSCAKCLCIVL